MKHKIAPMTLINHHFHCIDLQETQPYKTTYLVKKVYDEFYVYLTNGFVADTEGGTDVVSA
jgi:hypothetical protein